LAKLSTLAQLLVPRQMAMASAVLRKPLELVVVGLVKGSAPDAGDKASGRRRSVEPLIIVPELFIAKCSEFAFFDFITEDDGNSMAPNKNQPMSQINLAQSLRYASTS
jgi:hypothetical protein